MANFRNDEQKRVILTLSFKSKKSSFRANVPPGSPPLK